jgi:hypothetical protein
MSVLVSRRSHAGVAALLAGAAACAPAPGGSAAAPPAGRAVERVEELPPTAASRTCARRVRIVGSEREYILRGFRVTRVETTVVAGAGSQGAGEVGAVGEYAPAPVGRDGASAATLRVDCRASRVL